MAKVMEHRSTRNRNLYYVTCGLMAAVTDHRFGIQSRRAEASQARLREIINDVASAKLALPSWVLNPVRCMRFLESEQEHHDRLDALLLLGW